MKKYLLFFLVLWGATIAAQRGELVGTFSVESSTGSDPSPTVTGYFNSTVGFLPQVVDTGDVVLVRQVFSGFHRRKLYRVTGITGNSPLTLSLLLIDGTTGGPFPAGTQAVLRPTLHGSLLDVPNVSQELESYGMNYTIKNLESMDVDTVLERNDSLFMVLNNDDEYYVGPTSATAIDTSYQVGDSIYIVSAGDTIFTGIAYANPEIDTIYNDGTNYYMVTVEGDTIEIGAVAQVTANGAHPSNPPTYLIHIDTLGTDTIYFDNNGVWSRFNVGGTQIGAPMFTTNNNYATFTPLGIPPIGAFIFDADRGGITRKISVAGYTGITASNGRNVRHTDRYTESSNLANWNIGLNASASLIMTSTRALVSNPPDIATGAGIGGLTSVGNNRLLLIDNSSGSPGYVRFGSAWRGPNGLQLDSILVIEGSKIALDFNWDLHDGENIMRLASSSPAGSGTTYTFIDQANGIDLANASGTVTVSPDITELLFATVVGADSVMIWDSSINGHRRTSVADIVALASAGSVTVTDQANGLDITLTGSSISIAPDYGEVANTAVAAADSLLIYDVSLAQYRRVNAGSIAALATSGVSGVNDQANGLDITLSGGNIAVAYDFDEVPSGSGYTGLEQILYKDLFDGVYKKISLSTLSTGYVDLVSGQTIGGVKKFTAGLQYGSGTLPGGVNLGAADQTTFGLKAGQTVDPAESSWQNFGGLLVMNYQQALGGARQVTRFVATGTDSGPNGSDFKFDVRTGQSGANVLQGLKITTNSLNIPSVHVGNVIGTYPTANLQVAAGDGVGFESAGVPFRLSAAGSGGQEFKVIQGAGAGITTASIDASLLGWNDGSDSVLKKNIVPIRMTREQIALMEAYTFDWKFSDSADVSVIAQDLLYDPILSLAVRGVEGEDTLKVSARALASLAFGACKSLQMQIDSLTQGNADTVASGSNLALDKNKDVFVITGTTTINTISSTGRRAGSEITLLFTSNVTVNDTSGTGAALDKEIKLEGGADFNATNNDVLKLMFNGTNWLQSEKSVN